MLTTSVRHRIVRSLLVLLVGVFGLANSIFVGQSFAVSISNPNIKTSSSSVYVTKGSYGAITSLTNKGYTKLNIIQVADAATSPTTSCATTDADPRLQLTGSTCETHVPSAWEQQGVAGIGGSGYSTRNDIILVSWHSGDDKRGRLTVMNKTTGKQSFVELVRPCNDSDGYCYLSASATSSNCGPTHAGGISWYKQTLLMTDEECIIGFDLNNIFRQSNGTLLLPTTHYWRQTSNVLHLNTNGLDIESSTPQLLVAEYVTESSGESHIGHWDLDPVTATIKLDSGSSTRATADILRYTPTTFRIQGIAYTHGMYFLDTSGAGRDYMYRYRLVDTAPPDTRFLMPDSTPQGVYVDPTSGLMWGLTENAAQNGDGKSRVFSYTTASATQSP
jgi:hypothetical protein